MLFFCQAREGAGWHRAIFFRLTHGGKKGRAHTHTTQHTHTHYLEVSTVTKYYLSYLPTLSLSLILVIDKESEEGSSSNSVTYLTFFRAPFLWNGRNATKNGKFYSALTVPSPFFLHTFHPTRKTHTKASVVCILWKATSRTVVSSSASAS